MNTYSSLSDIEIRWQTAGGVCIIVEGETDQDDAWFYNRWFNHRPGHVTFYPQNGWEKVTAAVTELRQRNAGNPVYGIIDRDYATTPAYPPAPADGILRTRKFATENYLLRPDCWFRCIEPYLLRNPRPHWASPDLVRGKIEALYQECLPITAYNWTLREARRIDFDAFKNVAEHDRKDRVHPDQFRGRNPLDDLNGIATTMGITDDLGEIYQDRLAYLQTCDLEELEELVNGKFVMKLLRQSFPIQPLPPKTWDDMLSSYIFHCSHPPSDLAALVDAILADAQTA